MRKDKKDFLRIKIFWLPTVKEIFYQGEAEVISSQNKLGKFDILPQHTNFITLIFDSLSIISPDKKKTTYQFKRGVLEVAEDNVNIFLGW